MDIGKAIKLLLQKRNMSQKDLAQAAGLSETTISLILTKKSRPRTDTLEAIAKVLDVSPEMLLFLGLNKDDVPADRKHIYDAMWPVLEKTFMTLFVK